jgi:hypothetical protein
MKVIAKNEDGVLIHANGSASLKWRGISYLLQKGFGRLYTLDHIIEYELTDSSFNYCIKHTGDDHAKAI